MDRQRREARLPPAQRSNTACRGGALLLHGRKIMFLIEPPKAAENRVEKAIRARRAGPNPWIPAVRDVTKLSVAVPRSKEWPGLAGDLARSRARRAALRSTPLRALIEDWPQVDEDGSLDDNDDGDGGGGDGGGVGCGKHDGNDTDDVVPMTMAAGTLRTRH